jgi:hypothetical protein
MRFRKSTDSFVRRMRLLGKWEYQVLEARVRRSQIERQRDGEELMKHKGMGCDGSRDVGRAHMPRLRPTQHGLPAFEPKGGKRGSSRLMIQGPSQFRGARVRVS